MSATSELAKDWIEVVVAPLCVLDALLVVPLLVGLAALLVVLPLLVVSLVPSTPEP